MQDEGGRIYTVRYLPEAFDELMAIAAYLTAHSQLSAGKFFDEVEAKIERLTAFPRLYPLCVHDEHFRMMPVVYDYQVYYHVDEEAGVVEIHHFLHGKRNIAGFLKRAERQQGK